MKASKRGRVALTFRPTELDSRFWIHGFRENKNMGTPPQPSQGKYDQKTLTFQADEERFIEHRITPMVA